MIEGILGRVPIGDSHPVRLMGVINLSRESFYKGSVASRHEALALAAAMQEEGADIIDLGAVSTAPGSPPISEAVERERLFPALKDILESLDITISIDTQRSGIAADALSLGADCINDVSGLSDPNMAASVADHDGSLIIMASRKRAGDLLNSNEIIALLGERVRAAVSSGVGLDKISVDPGIGKWIPEKTPAHDLAILAGMQRLRALGRPVVAALSRKSFIGDRLHKPDPYQRLAGTLAATAIAVYLGAHVVRTHDIADSRDTIVMAQAIRGGPARSADEEMEVEVLGYLGQGEDMAENLRRTDVDERGYAALCKKSSFRVLSVRGLSSMEAIIIKQEMLARGGDAAIPKLALRCDPRPEEVLIFGTTHQISGLIKNLSGQPFRLSSLAKRIAEAVAMIDSPERYR
ncbi:MAG: dihydropteroate synthase [Methanosaeta sp. PtaU1.Bin112]|nr:MAG: dihydropteroate synthase [Methanosaeta sp. PtaU1.Bin112]